MQQDSKDVTIALVALALLFLLVGAMGHCQTLPDSPRPKLLDTTNKIAFTALLAVRTADTVQTCGKFGPRWREHDLPVQSCAGVAAFNYGFTAAGLGAAYLLQRHGHTRLARWAAPLATVGSAVGILQTSGIIKFKRR